MLYALCVGSQSAKNSTNIMSQLAPFKCCEMLTTLHFLETEEALSLPPSAARSEAGLGALDWRWKSKIIIRNYYVHCNQTVTCFSQREPMQSQCAE